MMTTGPMRELEEERSEGARDPPTRSKRAYERESA